MKNTGVMSGDDRILESLLIQDGEAEPRDQVLLYEALIEYFKKWSDEGIMWFNPQWEKLLISVENEFDCY